MSGDVKRGRCGRRGRRSGRRHGGAHGSAVLFSCAAGLVLAEYARNGERRVRRCGRLDGRRFATATAAAAASNSTASVAGCHRGRGRSSGHHHRLAGGRYRPVTGAAGGRSAVAVAAQLVVVVVAGHVDSRRLGHAAVGVTVADILAGTDGIT